MMQGEEACHVKKQMRDIPETLQDNMGQKMRLTVNGFAVKSPARLLSITLPSLTTHRGNHYANISKCTSIYVHVASHFWILMLICIALVKLARDSLCGHALVAALTSASSTHVTVAVVLGEICWLGLREHRRQHMNINISYRHFVADLGPEWDVIIIAMYKSMYRFSVSALVPRYNAFNVSFLLLVCLCYIISSNRVSMSALSPDAAHSFHSRAES